MVGAQEVRQVFWVNRLARGAGVGVSLKTLSNFRHHPHQSSYRWRQPKSVMGLLWSVVSVALTLCAIAGGNATKAIAMAPARMVENFVSIVPLSPTRQIRRNAAYFGHAEA
jgi:hypothetical protein